MNDAERRLRDSLAARADDVEPTPDLWTTVRDRRERARRRRRFVLAAAAGGLAVVVAAMVVLPDLVRRDGPAPFIESSPTSMPSPAASAVVPSQAASPDVRATAQTPAEEATDRAISGDRDLFVTTTGSDILVVADNGRPLVTVVDDLPSNIIALAVRPGSTAEDLTAVYLQENEGGYVLGWLTAVPTAADMRPLPPPYQLRNPATTGSVPAPVWSPDGRHLAWVEDGTDGPVLRTIGWTDGPGTGRSADDNADLVALPADPAERARLEEWVWTEETNGRATGYVAYSSLGRPFGVHSLVVERQADGALAVPPGDPAIESTFPETNHLDLAVTGGGVPVHLLIGDGSEEGVVDLKLRMGIDADEGQLAVPDELRQTSDPTSVWLSGARDGVVVGSGGRAWLSRPGEDPRPLHGPAPVWYADAIP